MRERDRDPDGEMARWFAAGEDLDDFIFYWDEWLYGREDANAPAPPARDPGKERG